MDQEGKTDDVPEHQTTFVDHLVYSYIYVYKIKLITNTGIKVNG